LAGESFLVGGYEFIYFRLFQTMNAELFQKSDSYTRLPCDARYSRLWMHYFLPPKIVDEMFYFAEKINYFNLTQGEIITVCAIQLTNPGKSELHHAAIV
jgi:hypothetical protein